MEGTPCDEAAPLGVIESGKQDRRDSIDTASTAASADSSLGSESEESDTDNRGVKLSGTKFPCPHCFQKFETEGELYQHDKCMVMPSEMVDAAKSGNGTVISVGLKLDGKIQCPDCNQKFDTEKSLSMHCKFIHAQESLMNVGYTLVYEFDKSKHVGSSSVPEA